MSKILNNKTLTKRLTTCKILAKKTLSKRQTIRKNKQQSSKQTSPNKIHHKSARLRRVYKNLIRKSKISIRQRDNTPKEKPREMPNSPESKS